jgi:phosphoglycerate dehydrogenase-like enzyme
MHATRARPKIVCLNGTCLDVVDDLRAQIDAMGIEFVGDDAFRTLAPQDVDRVIGDAAGLILPSSIRSLPHAEHMQRHPSLRVLSIAASGYDWLDVEAATRHGIVVTNVVGGVGAEVVADMAWALMLAVARQIPHHDRVVQAGGHERRLGASVWKKTLGVVGLGHIGKAVVRRARGFDMNVLVATSHPDRAFLAEHRAQAVPLDALLAQSDFVSLHDRLTATNRDMIGPRELALMKPTAFLINTARRELVDEAALIDAIHSRRIAGAGLDDPPTRRDNPLLGLPNVIFTPHLGNRAVEGVQGVFLEALDNAVAVLEGRRPKSVVNPRVYDVLQQARP